MAPLTFFSKFNDFAAVRALLCDHFLEGMLFYDIRYSGRRRQLIVVSSQYIIPCVSILTLLCCVGILPEGVVVNKCIYS